MSKTLKGTWAKPRTDKVWRCTCNSTDFRITEDGNLECSKCGFNQVLDNFILVKKSKVGVLVQR